MADMPGINVLIRPKLVNDALSSVLLAAGFTVFPKADQCDHGVVLIGIDDYEERAAGLAHQQNGGKIVMLTNEPDCRGLAPEQIGALSSILTYDSSAAVFVRSIRLICSGERVFPRELTERSKSQTLLHENSPPRSDVYRLSPRESEILSHLVDGHSNKGIARILGITEATVKVHLKSVQRKIRVDNRTQAAIWALSNLPTPSPKTSPQAA